MRAWCFHLALLWIFSLPGVAAQGPSPLVSLPDWYPSALQRRAGTPSPDSHAGSPEALRWKTGVPDPRIDQVPAAMIQRLRRGDETALADIARFLQSGAVNNYQTVKRIFDWVTANHAYDSDSFNGRAGRVSGFENTLRLGRSTCGGFADIFGRMASAVGIEAVRVGSDSKMWFSGENLSDHAWNLVRLDGKWHLVDTTYGGRLTYRNGRQGELKEYGDQWLLASPLSRLITAVPDPEKQYVQPPWTREQILTLPEIYVSALRIGAVFDFNGLPGNFTKQAERASGGKWGSLVDVWQPEDPQGVVKVDVPANTVVYATLRNQAGERLPDTWVTVNHSPAANGRTETKVTIILRQAGYYELRVTAARTGPEGREPTATIYKMTIDNTANRVSSRYDTNLVAGSAWTIYGIERPREFPQWRPVATDPAWYYLDVPRHQNHGLYGALYGLDGTKLTDAYTYSNTSRNTRRYFFLPQERPTVMWIYANRPPEERYTHPLLIGTLSARTVQPLGSTEPIGEFIVWDRLHEQGYTLDDKPAISGRRTVFHLGGIRGRTMRIRLRDSLDNSFPENIVLEPAGNPDTLRVSVTLPEAPGTYKVTGYHRLETGSLQNIFTLLLQ